MLEKPAIQDRRIADWILDQYGVQIAEVEFLPTGYQNTAAYRISAQDDKSYFLKLRRDVFEQTSVTIPAFLREAGIRQIIAPIATQSHRHWAYLDEFNVILYPFIDGHNGFQMALTEDQWIDFGSALRRIHSTLVPAELGDQIHQETYSQEWREKVKTLLRHARKDGFDQPVAAQLAALMTTQASEILHLVHRAEQLGFVLQTQSPEFVLCHSDIHAGNILCSSDGTLYMVDWDNPIWAPRERDLMFIGGGIGGIWNSTREEALFYRGYGKAKIDPAALAYYRCERILQDVAVYAEQFFLHGTSNPDSLRTLRGIAGFFLPNGVVEMAHQTEKSLPAELK